MKIQDHLHDIHPYIHSKSSKHIAHQMYSCCTIQYCYCHDPTTPFATHEGNKTHARTSTYLQPMQHGCGGHRIQLTLPVVDVQSRNRSSLAQRRTCRQRLRGPGALERTAHEHFACHRLRRIEPTFTGGQYSTIVPRCDRAILLRSQIISVCTSSPGDHVPTLNTKIKSSKEHTGAERSIFVPQSP